MHNEICPLGEWVCLALGEMDILGDEKTVSFHWSPGTSLESRVSTPHPTELEGT